MSKVTLHTLAERKASGQKFAVLTAYDALFARTITDAGTEVILVGDSLGMVLQGHSSTVPVTVADMAYHTACVRRGVDASDHDLLVMADMPFMGCATLGQALDNSAQLMRAGANMVKLEGGAELCEIVRRLAENGVPVCAHLGLTPQSVNCFGGYRVQGRQQDQAREILESAQALVDAGAAIILLECVPEPLATQLSKQISAPTIGIGAGAGTDGQVLVMHDMLGLGEGRKPRFVKNFLTGGRSIAEAFQAYGDEVRSGAFPQPEHWFAE